MKLLLENWNKFLREAEDSSENMLSDHRGAAEEIMANTLSAENAFRDEAGDLMEEKELPPSDIEFEVSQADSPNDDVVKRFYVSLNSGKRSGFLTYYTDEELRDMHLYLVKGHNAGFAIKTDGDIVSVHNNSSLKGLANKFLSEAKQGGGSKLDHFDGFLSGLYRKHGFTDVSEVYQWDEDYKPKDWTYDSIDIFNEKTSIYAHAVENNYNVGRLLTLTAEDGFEIKAVPADKVNQYRYGRPDVVFRKL
tara:strand:+ start:185 stop:931 length:747 start_codon:yes stop_codon:yes gene_type:complete